MNTKQLPSPGQANKMRAMNNRCFQSSRRLLSTAGAVAAAIGILFHADVSVAADNFQVNQRLDGPFSSSKQNEPSLAQNPTNPQNLIVGANDQIAEPACTVNQNGTPVCPRPKGTSIAGFYASFDGGSTWPCQGLIDVSAFGEYAFGDPTLAFDSRGNAYYGTIAWPDGALAGAAPSDFFVAKSTDGGCSYHAPAKVSGASQGLFDDKIAIAADANANSPFRDNVYATWAILPGFSVANQIMFARSTDGGVTWSPPLHVSPADSTAATLRSGAAVQVGPDGTVYVAWVNTKGSTGQPAAIHLTISHDGGKTFLPLGRDITVAAVTDDGKFLSATNFRQQGGRVFPSLTIAPNGTLHVVWCNHINNHSIVMTTKSTDGGLTWSAPIVAGNVSDRSAFFASVTADPANNVDVVFQALDDKPKDTAPGAGVALYDTYLAQSKDGGTSFGVPVKISTASSDPDGSGLNSLRAQFLGDYITAVADSRGGRVFGVWTDSRNATPCPAVDAYQAAIAAGTQPSPTPPNVITDCPLTFGNTDIFFGTVAY